eukprot:UN10316
MAPIHNNNNNNDTNVPTSIIDYPTITAIAFIESTIIAIIILYHDLVMKFTSLYYTNMMTAAHKDWQTNLPLTTTQQITQSFYHMLLQLNLNIQQRVNRICLSHQHILHKH